MNGYYVFYESEYVSSNCDNIEWFETIEEVEEFVDELPKWYAYRIQECK